MFYGPYKCKNKNEIQHFINMAILNEDYISNLSELMWVIKVDFIFIFDKSYIKRKIYWHKNSEIWGYYTKTKYVIACKIVFYASHATYV